MKSKPTAPPSFAALSRMLAREVGAKVVSEDAWKVVGQIVFPNGRKSYFRYNTLDINPHAASEIAKDKDYANFFLLRMKYPTVKGEAFYSDDWCTAIGSRRNIHAAYRYAKASLPWPVLVKPNSGSHGQGVAKVHTKKEFYEAMEEIFKIDRIALVQEIVHGNDYRVVVFDGQVYAAYERLPLSVVGDGKRSIRTLLRQKEEEFKAAHRDTRLKGVFPRIERKLSAQMYSLATIPTAGERVVLLDNANLSSGGEGRDVTSELHPAWKDLAVQITRDMGLKLCGVDFMIEGSIEKPPKKYHVLEVNSSPGLHHYMRLGPAQVLVATELYRKVFAQLAK